MTDDRLFGEVDLEEELKEKDEIIMSLRLNEHLLNDKLEISRRNMSKQLERITALEKENNKLKKQLEDCKDYNSKLYANCLQKDRKWIKEVKRLDKELYECIDTITEQKRKVARVLNEYSRQFRRHSKEFSFMLDLAEDLGVQSLEAKDD